MTSVMPMTSTITAAPGQAPGFLGRFLPVWGLGLLGVSALLLQAPPAALFDRDPALRDVSPVLLRLLLIVNPLLLVTAMAAVGAALAPRAGLRSRLAGDPGAPLDVRTALAAGLGVAAMLWGIDTLLDAWLGPGCLPADLRAAAATPGWTAPLIGVLYGGLAEEVMLRWGLMSLVAWGVGRALQRAAGQHPGFAVAAAWAGIAVAAAAFAAGHLPALTQVTEPGDVLVARTLALNALAGMVYGWLFWRRSLECAMLAHAATHGAWAIARLLG